jgi:hypothetical protein
METTQGNFLCSYLNLILAKTFVFLFVFYVFFFYNTEQEGWNGFCPGGRGLALVGEGRW